MLKVLIQTSAQIGRNKGLRLKSVYLLNLWLLFCHLGQVVSASSWIQFNKATRTLIAVPIQSHFKSQTSISYQIQAINSAGKKAYSKFTASLKDTPYTSDCKMSMDFRYMYQTENLVDLDLILIFINKVSEFYSDNRNSIKILDFTTRSYNYYRIVWSNCSFEFQTRQEALFGLSQADKSKIDAIFQRVISLQTNEVLQEFKNYMSAYFQILKLSVNYDCIEEPPFPPNGTKEYTFYATSCELFNRSIPYDTFYDKRDGFTDKLTLTLLSKDGNLLSSNEWLNLDKYQNIYGVVTENTKRKSPLQGYMYVLNAKDSSGRTANVTVIVKVNSPTKWFDVYFSTGFYSNLEIRMNTGDMLYLLSKKLSEYINPSKVHHRRRI